MAEVCVSSAKEIEDDEYNAASAEKSSSVDSDKFPFSTGWESIYEDEAGVRDTKLKKASRKSMPQLPIKRL